MAGMRHSLLRQRISTLTRGGHSNGIDAGGKRIMIQPRELGKLQPALDPEPAMDPYLGPLLGTLFMENRKWGLRR